MDNAKFVEDVKTSLALIEEMKRALLTTDEYFRACARAWAANEGRVVTESGAPLVEAEGLDELANKAGIAVGQAVTKMRLAGLIDG